MQIWNYRKLWLNSNSESAALFGAATLHAHTPFSISCTQEESGAWRIQEISKQISKLVISGTRIWIQKAILLFSALLASCNVGQPESATELEQ